MTAGRKRRKRRAVAQDTVARRGRPPSADPRTERKEIRLTPAQAAAQQAAAKADGMTWSAWIVEAADLAIERASEAADDAAQRKAGESRADLEMDA